MTSPVHPPRDTVPGLEDAYLDFPLEEPGAADLTESLFIVEPVSSGPSTLVAHRRPQDDYFDRSPAATLLATHPVLAGTHVVVGAGVAGTYRVVRRVTAQFACWTRRALDISRVRVPVANLTLVAFSGGTAVGAFVMWLVGVLPAQPPVTASSVTPVAAVAAPAVRAHDRAATLHPAAPVTAPGKPTPVEQPEGASSVTVTSAPAGARVTVDGIGWGKTPVTIHNLPAGQKVIRVTKDGYTSQQQIVGVLDGRPSAAVRVTLRASR